MDEEDCGFITVKNALNSEKIKLWLAPYHVEDVDVLESLMALAATLSGRLGMPSERILDYLKVLQEKSLGNLKEKAEFEKSGVACLKIRAPSREAQHTSFKIALSLDGNDLKSMISEYYQVPPYKLKLISHGRLIKDDVSLERQGVKHGSQIMTLLIQSGRESVELFENNNALLSKTRKDVVYLTEKDNLQGDAYLQITDQTGKQLDLPENERKALVMAMTLHEKGRAALKKENFELALLLLLEAEQEFNQCNSALLQHVDNYGLLSLDVIWCYLNLRNISQLPNAEARLKDCEKAFHKSYGSNLERLVALKGSTGCEAALFLRLHLLQAIVLYHQGKIEAAKGLFNQVDAELKELHVDEEKLRNLVEIGYSEHDARIALRETKNNANLAAASIDSKLAERKRIRKEDKRLQDVKRVQRTLGVCKNGQPVDVSLHTSLISMGYSSENAKWALAQTNNNINDALTIFQEQPQQLIDDQVIAEIVSFGFDCQAAIDALRKHDGNKEAALQELFASNTASSSHDVATTSKKVKTEKDYKNEKKAFDRVADGIANDIDDYLDLTLTAEEGFLRQYQQFIADASQPSKSE